MSEFSIKRAGKFGNGATYEIEVAVLKIKINGIEVKSDAMVDFIELKLKGSSESKKEKEA